VGDAVNAVVESVRCRWEMSFAREVYLGGARSKRSE